MFSKIYVDGQKHTFDWINFDRNNREQYIAIKFDGSTEHKKRY